MNASSNRFEKKTLEAQAVAVLARRDTAAGRVTIRRDGVADAMSQRDRSNPLDDEAPKPDSDPATDLVLLEWAERLLREIDQALARLADGTYGYCDDCGADIPLQRLRSLPTVPMCFACSEVSPGVWQVDRNRIRQGSGEAIPSPGSSGER